MLLLKVMKRVSLWKYVPLTLLLRKNNPWNSHQQTAASWEGPEQPSVRSSLAPSLFFRISYAYIHRKNHIYKVSQITVHLCTVYTHTSTLITESHYIHITRHTTLISYITHRHRTYTYMVAIWSMSVLLGSSYGLSSLFVSSSQLLSSLLSSSCLWLSTRLSPPLLIAGTLASSCC